MPKNPTAAEQSLVEQFSLWVPERVKLFKWDTTKREYCFGRSGWNNGNQRHCYDPMPMLLGRWNPLSSDAFTTDYCSASSSRLCQNRVETRVIRERSALLTIWDLNLEGRRPKLSIARQSYLWLRLEEKGGVVNPEGIPDWLSEQLPDSKFWSETKSRLLLWGSCVYRDLSGSIRFALVKFLESSGAEVTEYKVIRMIPRQFVKRWKTIVLNFILILWLLRVVQDPATRCHSPDVNGRDPDKMLDGFGDLCGAESLNFTG